MDNTHGKLTDVLIDDHYEVDQATGIRVLSGTLTVWADDGKKEAISSVDGVTSAHHAGKGSYLVFLDPRYDREYVKREIEAVVLCGGQQ